MKAFPGKWTWVLGAAVASGCQTVPVAQDYSMQDPQTGTYAPSPAEAAYQAQAQDMADAYQYQNVEPAAGRSPAYNNRSSYAMNQQGYAAQAAVAPQAGISMAELSKLRDRLERVERAMLRLDRRMQLVEKNELNRMDGPTKVSQNEDGTEQAVMQAADAGIPGQAPAYGEGFQAVSQPITSALQAAPRGTPSSAPQQMASNTRSLPSLADGPSKPTGKGEEAVSIWTVRYENGKTWPDRNQLPASRDVVEALRNGTGTLYARGNQPNSVAFRDRVKALSRYLSKVTSQDSVPIAAMSAPHLDDNTIEIFATH